MLNKYIYMFINTFFIFSVFILVIINENYFSDFTKIVIALLVAMVIGYLIEYRLKSAERIDKYLEAHQISKIGFWELRLPRNKLFCSNEIFEIFEIDKKNFTYTYDELLKAIHPNDKNLVDEAHMATLKNRHNHSIKYRLLMNDGRVKWIKEEWHVKFDKKNNPSYLISIVSDITSEVEYQQKIKDNEQLLNSIINANDDLLFFKDKNFNYLGCNEAFLEFVGKTKEEMIGHNDFELFSEDMASLFRKMDIAMLEKNEISSNYEWITYPNGEKKYLITKKIPFNYTTGEVGVLGISRDITQLHIAQKKIKSQTYIDELTKLNNRKSYNERIEMLLTLKKRYKTPFTMFLFDIDDFKYINDTYGHKMGDNVLIEISALVKSHVRSSDYFFRIGGEEFIILFTETSLDNALTSASKICKSVEENLNTIKNETITISGGISEANENDSEDTIFTRVDNLLYNAKRAGKNRIVSII